MNARIRAALVAAFLAAPAAAQQQEPPPALTPEMAAEYVAFYNAETTTRMSAPVRVSAGSAIDGDVAVLDGPLLLDGAVRGSVLVLNGDAVLGRGAVVEGDLVVTGGSVRGLDSARVDGDVRAFREPVRYHRVGDRLVAEAPPREEPITAVRAGREFRFGRTDLVAAVRGSYNRIEGLPIAFGPRLTLGGSNPTVLEALVVYRTETGFDFATDRLGYAARVEQFLGGRHHASVGAAVRSEIVPIEDVGLSDLEASLATFLLHRDYRDYYQREGWVGFLKWRDPGLGLTLRAEYRDERERTRAANDPWTPFRNDDPFRPQPAIADGTLRSVVLGGSYDSRNEVAEPASGWWIQAEVEQGLAGSLALPIVPVPGADPAPGPQRVDVQFSTLLLDVRRYARLGPSSRIALRLLGAGSIDGDPLPPQRQRALGGEGTLPAYPLLEFDCGARRATYPGRDGPLFPYYGCDRSALVQLAYERTLAFMRPLGRRFGWDFDLGPQPALSLFFDAGRAWVEDDARVGRTGGLDDFVADAGFGVRFGRVGVYWAFPLSSKADGVNFFVRLGPRL